MQAAPHSTLAHLGACAAFGRVGRAALVVQVVHACCRRLRDAGVCCSGSRVAGWRKCMQVHAAGTVGHWARVRLAG